MALKPRKAGLRSRLGGPVQKEGRSSRLLNNIEDLTNLYEARHLEEHETVTMESRTVKHTAEDDCADNGILLQNVLSNVLSKLTEHCKRHVEASFTHQQRRT